MSILIKRCDPSDWERWKSLRIEALTKNQESFARSAQEEEVRSANDFIHQLADHAVFVACDQERFVGMVGFSVFPGVKRSHQGYMYGMYVNDEYRGKGIGNLLLDKLIDHARGVVIQISSSVVTDNVEALGLYKKYGFTIYGTAPKALKVGNRFYDEHLIMLPLI